MNRSSIALSNLRGVVILIVLAFHSVLAYLASLPIVPHAFDQPPYRWQAIPIVDSQRFFGFDLFCAWQDVSLMSLMFFLSGLFVPASLARKGAVTFLSDRFFRIGLPLVLVVAFLMPLTYYPTFSLTAADPSVGAYWQHLTALPFWLTSRRSRRTLIASTMRPTAGRQSRLSTASDSSASTCSAPGRMSA